MFVRSQLSSTIKGDCLFKSSIGKALLIALTVCTFACANDSEKNVAVVKSEGVSNKQVSFSKTRKHLPLKNSNLRKWDVATVADLDQDGFPDLLLNDHGFSLKVLWNNNGRFGSEGPYYG
jgi:hypothetical protein